jgi:hypothetical protein
MLLEASRTPLATDMMGNVKRIGCVALGPQGDPASSPRETATSNNRASKLTSHCHADEKQKQKQKQKTKKKPD